MRLVNNSDNNLRHTLVKNDKPKTYVLKVGEQLEVPAELGEIWLKLNGIEKIITEADVEKAKAKAVAESKKTKKK